MYSGLKPIALGCPAKLGKLLGPTPSHVRDGSPTIGFGTGSLFNWISSADSGHYWLVMDISGIAVPPLLPSPVRRARQARRPLSSFLPSPSRVRSTR